MSVSDARSRSARSATTCSLSFLSIESPPRTSRARLPGVHEQRHFDSLEPPRQVLRPEGLPAVFGDGRVDENLRGRLLFLELRRDLTRLGGVDVDPGPHGARESDRADVAPLCGGRLGANDLLDD